MLMRSLLQPFLALGMKLREQGHRVRLASHAIFKELIIEHGLEFYPLGGDPQQLSAYMVSNNNNTPFVIYWTASSCIKS